MPAVSRKQQRFMGAELQRKREGKKTKTGMSEKQLEEYASTKRKGLPEKKQDHAEENAKERMKMTGGGMMSKEMKKKHQAKHKTKKR